MAPDDIKPGMYITITRGPLIKNPQMAMMKILAGGGSEAEAVVEVEDDELNGIPMRVLAVSYPYVVCQTLLQTKQEGDAEQQITLPSGFGKSDPIGMMLGGPIEMVRISPAADKKDGKKTLTEPEYVITTIDVRKVLFTRSDETYARALLGKDFDSFDDFYRARKDMLKRRRRSSK